MDSSLSALIAANPWIIALLVWATVWKLIALWKAARRNHLTFFIVLAVVNTVGLLEIIYVFWLYFKERKNKTQM